jgi:cell wall-associated NlpC family hydrolase
MTTPSTPDFGSAAAGSRLLGSSDLQTHIDSLTQAVKANTQAVQGSSSGNPAGVTTPIGTTGQTSTFGSFPSMNSVASHFTSGIPANYATTPTGGNGNGQGGWGQATTNPADTLGAAGSSMANMASAVAGGSQFSTQTMMNQFASMSVLGMSPGNVGAQQQSMYNMAFGRYGGNVNALAQNPADAAQMYSNLQGITGNPYVMSTQQGRAGYGAAAGFGIANPALGGAGASAAAASLYNPMTSFTMRQLGYGTLPRTGANGQWSNMAQVAQGMLQRWYGKGSVSQGTLNAGLANGGIGSLNLQAIGQSAQTMGPALQMYNKLFSQGVGTTQAQTMLNDAAQNKNYDGTSAQKLLSSKYGVPTSDLQKYKDSTAVQTSNTAGEMGGFDSAISQATTTVQKFDKALGTILKVTGIGSNVGSATGFSGAMGAIGGGLGSIMSAGMGLGMGMLSQYGGAAGVVPGGGSATAGSNGSKPGSATTSVSRSAQVAIKDAMQQTGKPYVWGGDSPSVGFDCSGLIEWAYAQAGVKLPRTSQGQWAALRNRSVPLGKVQAGDILFSSGSDGTATSPGHEAMMISGKQIIEAPYTGANIRIRAYDAGEWQHAGRPSGSLAGGGTSGANGTGSALTTTGQGNSGSGMGVSTGGGGGLGLATGDYGSSSAADNISSALLGGITGGSGGAGLTTWTGHAGGSAFGSAGNGQGSPGGKSSASKSSSGNVPTAGGGTPSANRALAQKMAKAMYGWTGSQWSALNKLWGTYESGFRDNAQNPGSTAYGIAQFLDSTWSGYGPKTSNPGLQIKYGLEYIHDRYRNPVDALQFELSHTPHWYGAGTGSARPGTALVGERGPELVRLSGGQQIANAGQTADILKGNAAKAAQTPWSAGTAQQLSLANMPQNAATVPGKAEVSLNFPQGAIVIHTNGSAADVSSNVRQIMAGVTRAMEDNDTLKKIMEGVTS